MSSSAQEWVTEIFSLSKGDIEVELLDIDKEGFCVRAKNMVTGEVSEQKISSGELIKRLAFLGPRFQMTELEAKLEGEYEYSEYYKEG